MLHPLCLTCLTLVPALLFLFFWGMRRPQRPCSSKGLRKACAAPDSGVLISWAVGWEVGEHGQALRRPSGYRILSMEVWALVQRAWRWKGKQYFPVLTTSFWSAFWWLVPGNPMFWKMLFSRLFALSLRLKSKFLSASISSKSSLLLVFAILLLFSIVQLGWTSVDSPHMPFSFTPCFVYAVPLPRALCGLSLTASLLLFFRSQLRWYFLRK